MRYSLFFILLLAAPFCGRSQCVVYTSKTGNGFGAGYNSDGGPTSYKECEEYAQRKCREAGSGACEELYRSNKAGWFGMAIGQHVSTGKWLFQGGDGFSSKSEAETAVRQKYRNNGGYDPSSVHVYTWYVYSNLKKDAGW
jgi:hypothetical protein